MIKKIFKWAGALVLLIVICISAVVPFRQNLKYEAPFPDLKASKDTTIIARGKSLVLGAAHCADCHSNANVDSLLESGADVPLAGGFKFGLPVGDIYSRNITPDSLTGIGKRTDQELARVLRYGVHANGTAVYEFMPFHNMTDEDLVSVISYLRSLKPVRNEVPENSLNVVGNMVKAFMIKPVGPDGEVPKSIKKDTSAAYGKYLAVSVANCRGCHTVRDLSGNYTGEPFAGGAAFDEKDGTFIPPNLTPHFTGRIWQWSQEAFVARFRTGKVLAGTPMPWNSFKRMSDDELKAIYNYLQTIKPVNNATAATFIPKQDKE
ncbi:MAG: c-type cytochrome [Chitinophagaceae bacterium]|nr:MAG: c-type cytochrome [Chitinophagaceae bacterium]